MEFEVIDNDKTTELELLEEESQVKFGDDVQSYEFSQQENGRYLLRMGSELYKIDNVSHDKHTVTFTLNDNWHSVEVRNEQDLLLDRLGFKTAGELGEGELNAPMPGKMLEILVEEGETVEMGDPVAILEAMKMENELNAPIDGTIGAIQVEEGDSLEKDVLILEIEASG